MATTYTSSKKTIAIIGAGVSGLQAARTLLLSNPHKYDVTIFEARSRIGGRVHTKQHWGFPLDFGLFPLTPLVSFIYSPRADFIRCEFHSRHGWKSID